MTDDEKLKQQLNSFDYIFPNITKRILFLERKQFHDSERISSLISDKKEILNMFKQYKKKTQRIEKILIDNGLISWEF